MCLCFTSRRLVTMGNNLAANAPVSSSPALRSALLARQAPGARSGPSQHREAPGTPLQCSRARAAQFSGRPALTELPYPTSHPTEHPGSTSRAPVSSARSPAPRSSRRPTLHSSGLQPTRKSAV